MEVFMSINTTVAMQRVKDLLTTKGISQRELASIINMREETISRFLNGKYEPSLDFLIESCCALHASLDSVLGIESSYNDDPGSIVSAVVMNASKFSSEQKKQIVSALV